jgi:hypothetical protein
MVVWAQISKSILSADLAFCLTPYHHGMGFCSQCSNYDRVRKARLLSIAPPPSKAEFPVRSCCLMSLLRRHTMHLDSTRWPPAVPLIFPCCSSSAKAAGKARSRISSHTVLIATGGCSGAVCPPRLHCSWCSSSKSCLPSYTALTRKSDQPGTRSGVLSYRRHCSW